MRKSLITFCLACLLIGCSFILIPDKTQSITVASPTNPTVDPTPTPSAVYRDNYDLLVTSSDPVIPSAVTKEEITIRE